MIWITALALAASPAEPAKASAIYGPGLLTCGQWIEGRRSSLVDAALSAWLGGYMTGVPIARPGDSAPRVDDMKLWVDTYCRAHPFEQVHTAAKALAADLQAR